MLLGRETTESRLHLHHSVLSRLEETAPQSGPSLIDVLMWCSLSRNVVACWEMLSRACACSPKSAELMLRMLLVSPDVSLTSKPPPPPTSPLLSAHLLLFLSISFYLSLCPPLSLFINFLSLYLTQWKRGTHCLSCHQCKHPRPPPLGLVMVWRTPMTDNDWANEFLN